MSVKFTNNAETTLASGINSSVTSLTVASSTGFPTITTGEYFYVTLDDGTNNEIVKVTAVSGTTWTIVRAQDNTTARSFSSSNKVELRVTAGLITDAVADALASSFAKNAFTGDGTETNFTLSQSPNSEDDLIVFIEGVFQNQSTYSLSGTTLTFSTAPANTRAIVVYTVKAAVSGANLNHDQFTASGSAAFTLSIAPINENNTQVFIDGVYQQKTDYAVSGTTLTFDTAPTSGAIVEVMTFTQTEVNVPATGSVVAASIANNVNLNGNPTTTTQSAGNNTTRIATTAFVETAVSNLIDSAPNTMNTLNEIAAALGDDPTFTTTVNNAIATKLPLAGGTMTGNITSASNFALDVEADLTLTALSDIIHQTTSTNSTAGHHIFKSYNTEIMRIDGGNNRVGIGTDSPDDLLDVENGNIRLRSNSEGNTGLLRMFDASGTESAQIYPASGDLKIYSPNDVLFTQSGNVGIGTTSPSTALHILGSSTSRNTIVSNVTIDGGTAVGYPYAGYGFGIDFKGKDYGNTAIREYGRIIAHMTNQTSQTEAGDAGFKSALSFYTNTGGASSTAATEKMTILSDGNVGIGTPSPSHSLHVLTTDNKGFLLERNTANNAANLNEFSTHYSLSIKNRNSGSYLNFAGAAAYSALQATDGAGSATAKILSLNPFGGNVGIGTTSPDGLLHLKGATNNTIKSDFTLADGTGTYTLHAYARNGTNKWRLGSKADDSYLSWYNDATNTHQFALKSDGNVGIGTTSPAETLSVAANGSMGVGIYKSPDGVLRSAQQVMAIGTGSSGSNSGSSGGNEHAIIQMFHDGDEDIRLYTQGNSWINGGKVGIGTASPSEIFHIYSPAESYWALKVDCVNSAYGIQTVGQGNFAIGILNSSSNTYRGRWDHNGTLYTQDGNVHDVDSDERLKEDITDCPSQWSLIKDLPLQRFKWKDKRNGDTFSYGWVAQATKTKYPEFVEPIPQPKEDIDEGKEDPEYLTVRSGDIQKRSIAALQEAMVRIEALEAEVAALKG